MKQQFLKLFFYTNEEINILKNEHNLFSGFLLPRPSKYYLIFTGYSFLWLLLSLVFIFSLLLKVFFNNTVWSRVLLWIRKHIWLNTFNLVSWFSVFLEIKYQAKHSHKTFQLYCFLSSRMICYLLKWKTQHCTGQRMSQKIFVPIIFYYGARESRITEIKPLMKTVEIPLTRWPSFLKIFLVAVEMLCVLIFCDYSFKSRQIQFIEKFTVFFFCTLK